jgi:hypothetical protein
VGAVRGRHGNPILLPAVWCPLTALRRYIHNYIVGSRRLRRGRPYRDVGGVRFSSGTEFKLAKTKAAGDNSSAESGLAHGVALLTKAWEIKGPRAGTVHMYVIIEISNEFVTRDFIV